jgi:hypothetical protein
MTYSPSDPFIQSIYNDLLRGLDIASLDPHHPIVVYHVPHPWQLLGAGNYAAVFHHPNDPDRVVKVYAPGRPGFEAEVEVYRRLGSHPAFSACFYADKNFLVLKRLYGITLYDCVHRGIAIPPQVIRDIDQALDYARQQGLYPHDVHGRNVMMADGRGLVVDVSDFLRAEYCAKWQNLKQAYFWLYRPLIAPLRLRIPYVLLDFVRVGYRLFCQLTAKFVRLRPKLHPK